MTGPPAPKTLRCSRFMRVRSRSLGVRSTAAASSVSWRRSTGSSRIVVPVSRLMRPSVTRPLALCQTVPSHRVSMATQGMSSGHRGFDRRSSSVGTPADATRRASSSRASWATTSQRPALAASPTAPARASSIVAGTVFASVSTVNEGARIPSFGDDIPVEAVS